MGEREPFEDLCSTHGICEGCVEADVMSDDDVVARTRPIKQLHARLGEIATAGRVEEVDDLIRRWGSLGLGPIELLIAVMQPALYLVGRAWERGDVTPAQEARLTSFCDEALAVLSAQQRSRIPVTKGPPILLLSAGGNKHDVGVKMLAFALREAARDVRVLSAPPPPDKLSTLCELLQPSIIGVSLALPAHADYVVQLCGVVATLPRPPSVVVGGGALASLRALPPGVVRWTASESLLGAAAFFADLERSRPGV